MYSYLYIDKEKINGGIQNLQFQQRYWRGCTFWLVQIFLQVCLCTFFPSDWPNTVSSCFSLTAFFTFFL